jgi:hypothetical protein
MTLAVLTPLNVNPPATAAGVKSLPQQYAAPLVVTPQVLAPALTVAKVRADTVIAAVPLCPSLVAVIVAWPAATPVASPVEFTVVTAGLLVAQVTVRPVSTFPAASLVVAVSCTVTPTSTVAGATVTDATGTGGAVTATAAVPFFPSDVAVIVAEPTATPVTNPVADTVATTVLLLAHVTARPVSTFPAESLVVAVSCAVLPTGSVPGDGATVTDATAGGPAGAGGEVESLHAMPMSIAAARSNVFVLEGMVIRPSFDTYSP